jgi:hypothetical protein
MTAATQNRSTGVPPVSRMGILPMFRGLSTGGTPVVLMGKMPMLLGVGK